MKSAFLAALLLAAAAASAGGDPGSVRVEIPSPGGGPLLEGVRGFLARIPGAPVLLAEGNADAVFQVRVDRAEGITAVETRMSRPGGAPQSLRSTFASAGAATLVSAVGSDILWLWRSAVGFPAPSTGEAPSLTASLSTGTLSVLWTGGRPGEPMGLAPAAPSSRTDAGFLLCLSDGVLTLGPLFRVTAETIRDAAAARERPFPDLLAAAAVDGTGCLAALDAEATRVDFLDPVTGRRGSAALPPGPPGGGKIAGLPEGAAVLRQDGLYLAVRAPEGVRIDAVPLPPGRVLSALAADPDGDIWVFDATERRLRVLSPRGVEVRSLRPLIPRSRMGLPQELAVFPDGSFLMAGSGEVWKFDSAGTPVWALSRLPGTLGEALPASMSLAAAADGCFYVLDAPGKRILRFSDAADRGADEAPLPVLRQLYGNTDPRDARGAERIADVARQSGLALLALQHADSMPAADREAARRALDRGMARAALACGRALEDGLLPGRALPLYERALELYRAARERDPADLTLGPAIEALQADRRRVREALDGQEPQAAASIRSMGERRGGYASSAALRVTVRNAGESPLRDIEAAACVPGHPERGRGTARLAALAPGASAVLDLVLPLSGPVDSITVMVSCTAGEERRRLPLSVLLTPAQAAGPMPADPIETLRASARKRYPVIARLLAPLRPEFPDVLELAANALEWLGGLRGEPPRGTWDIRDPQRTLWDLAATEADWMALTAAVLSELGIPYGWVENGDRPLLLVRTDMHAEEADALTGGDPRLASPLRTLSADGALCVPLSAAAPQAPGRILAASIAAGCRTLAALGPVIAVRWAAPSGAPDAETGAMSSPPALPGTQTRLDRDMVARAIRDALAGKDLR